MNEKSCDVLIIGAGMGGGCLARQLKLAMPNLKIIVVEKKKEFDYWIGESTVEVWTDYAYRQCGLGPYLHKHQMLKAGLRFFFDTPEKSLRMHEMSENGRSAYPGAPCDILSHQLDRATFDRDLCQMNQEMGIEVMLGTKVVAPQGQKEAIVIDGKNGHVVHTDKGSIRCKYVIDAAGRGAPLATQLNLTKKDPRHMVGSYWGRFKNFTNMDDLGDKQWHTRNNHVLRYLATNHYMYPGYWIWKIPLSDNLLSIGVSFHKDMMPDFKLKNGQELLEWFRTHRGLGEIMSEKTEVVDFMAFADCGRRADQFYSEDRWFLTGMSGFVLDALYSTTGPTTSFSNRLIAEMIKTDLAGDHKLFKKQVHHFNVFMHATYENILRTVSRYKEFGSFDCFIGWRNISQAHYYNTMIPASTEDMKTLFDTVRSHGGDCGCSLEKALEEQKKSLPVAVERNLKELYEYVQRTGNYFSNNKNQFICSVPRHSLVKKLWQPRDPKVEHKESLITYEASFRFFLKRMAHYEGVPWHESAFLDYFKRDWLAGQTLTDGLEAMKKANKTKQPVRKEDMHIRWISKAPVDDAGRELETDYVLNYYASRKKSAARPKLKPAARTAVRASVRAGKKVARRPNGRAMASKSAGKRAA